MTVVSQPHDPPFWAGAPDAKTFERRCDERLTHARAAIARIGAGGGRTVDDVIRPLDDAVLDLETVAVQSSLIENVHPDAELRATAELMSQKASALGTELSLDRRVYEAVAAVDLSAADPDTRHYVNRLLRDFRLAGVDRDDATRAKVSKLREELVEISQEFSRNIRSDRRFVPVQDAKELDGLPADYLARHAPDDDGTITISTDYPDVLPVLTYAHDDGLRHRLFMEFHNRAFPVNAEVLGRMLAKRHELAGLLGFASWADYATADKMVSSAGAVAGFIDRIAELSGPRCTADYAALLEHKRGSEPAATAVTAWESSYRSEQVRRSRYDFDAQSVRPYFPFHRVKKGVLDVSSRLFGVRFQQVDVPVWHPSVECYEVLESDRVVGRFYLDMHPRADKFSHAAEFDIRAGIAGRQVPEAALVCNFPGGDPTDPGLMEHGDVKTLFHEFGHLLHALFGGRRRWAGIGGISTESDFVEVPSQLYEEWIWDPAVLATFARHIETDEPIPAEIVTRMKAASEFGKGLGVRRQMTFARLSLQLHDRDPEGLNVDEVVQRVTNELQPIAYPKETHLQCSFGHLDGYSAAYYTYMWSLVISKDFFSRFDRGDLLDPKVALEYRKTVLDAGGSAPAAELVQRFLGREFSFEPYREWLEREE